MQILLHFQSLLFFFPPQTVFLLLEHPLLLLDLPQLPFLFLDLVRLLDELVGVQEGGLLLLFLFFLLALVLINARRQRSLDL